MASVIYKYPMVDGRGYSLPVDVVCLSIGVQNHRLVGWFQHQTLEPDTYVRPVKIRTIMTGEEFTPTPEWKYFGTAQIGAIVAHVYGIFQ
jgi:hypothetical protein